MIPPTHPWGGRDVCPAPEPNTELPQPFPGGTWSPACPDLAGESLVWVAWALVPWGTRVGRSWASGPACPQSPSGKGRESPSDRLSAKADLGLGPSVLGPWHGRCFPSALQPEF